MIEVGRHKRIHKSERFYPFCQRCVEDEVHFLINSRTHNEKRKISFDSALNLIPNFSFNTTQEIFAFLLSCENVSVEVANFIWPAMELRKPLMM